MQDAGGVVGIGGGGRDPVSWPSSCVVGFGMVGEGGGFLLGRWGGCVYYRLHDEWFRLVIRIERIRQ